MKKPVRKAAEKPALMAALSNSRLALTSAKLNAPGQNQPVSKQARVLEMLRSATGATIAGIMRETGWQQHSVRGFLAGVVCKKLGLKLQSSKVDGERIYGIASGPKTKLQAASKKGRN